MLDCRAPWAPNWVCLKSFDSQSCFRWTWPNLHRTVTLIWPPRLTGHYKTIIYHLSTEQQELSEGQSNIRTWTCLTVVAFWQSCFRTWYSDRPDLHSTAGFAWRPRYSIILALGHASVLVELVRCHASGPDGADLHTSAGVALWPKYFIIMIILELGHVRLLWHARRFGHARLLTATFSGHNLTECSFLDLVRCQCHASGPDGADLNLQSISRGAWWPKQP